MLKVASEVGSSQQGNIRRIPVVCGYTPSNHLSHFNDMSYIIMKAQ